MPDNRDFQKPKTPPVGVRAQTARPIGEPDEDSFDDFEGETPIQGDAFTKLQARARNASMHSKKAVAEIQNVRAELAAHRQQLDGKVDLVTVQMSNFRVDVTEKVGDVKGDVREMAGKLDVLMGSIEDERRARIESERIRALAQVEIMKSAELAKTEVEKNAGLAKNEVEKNAELAKAEIDKVAKITEVKVGETRELAAIDEEKKAADHRRKVRFRILVTALSVITGLVALLTRC